MIDSKTMQRKQRNTISTLLKMKTNAEKIVCLTCYDASFARLLEHAGIDIVLVGDSLGMVIQGHDTTLPVSIADMIYHSQCVARNNHSSLLVVDMPFMSYATIDQALHNAAQLMQQGGAQMVKLEGGTERSEIISALCAEGIPVCGHLGLLPQSIHRLGGYRVQGRDDQAALAIKHSAKALEIAGISLLVLECVPTILAREISAELTIPVIGIGAGVDCDGQVLVVYDILGLTPSDKCPKFVRNFLAGNGSIDAAINAYANAVKTGDFPNIKESFQ